MQQLAVQMEKSIATVGLKKTESLLYFSLKVPRIPQRNLGLNTQW